MHTHDKHDGAFRPSEVDLLARVLDKLNVKDMDEAKREALAQGVMANYMAGITDEDDLISLSRQPPGR